MPAATASAPCNLLCEYVTNPLGLDIAQPRLSWQLPVVAGQRGVVQTAFQIRVARTAGALSDDSDLLWDSGRMEGDCTTHVPYKGPKLGSAQRAWWSVTVWTNTGGSEASTSSEPAFWEMGLLAKSDWQGAEWIAGSWMGSARTTSPAPFMRREFDLGHCAVVSARLFATALGLYEFHLNGKRVGEDIFTPGWTDYTKRVQYQAYDVTPLLRPGANVAGAILGDGWYCGHVASVNRQIYGERPQLLAKLVIDFADGTQRTIVTDREWRVASGPILESDFIMGESYDARLELAHWCEPGAPVDARWREVEIFPDSGVPRVAQRGPTVRQMGTVKPTNPTATPSPSWGWTAQLVDLGQNMVGHVRLKVKAKRGVTIRLRFAEILDPKGGIYITNLRSARATDYYTCGSDEEETWEPRFTFHGFRYVEIGSQSPFELPPDGILGIVVHSNIPPTGEFECSDPLVNQLQHNIQWGQKGNFLEVPTDCPQRDERLGWTGDAQVFIRTAAFNAQVAGFFTKWQDDIDDAQSGNGGVPCVVPNVPGLLGVAKGSAGIDGGPAWADATVICPWTIYLCYGDKRLLEEHWPSLTKFVDYLAATSRDGTRCFPGCEYFGAFGDWLALDGSGKTEGGTSHELLGTAFFAHSARLLSQIAKVLGKDADAQRYEKHFETARAAFQREFVTPSGRIFGGTQTALTLALHFDLLPPEKRATASAALVADIRARKNQLATGFVGTPYLPHVLTATGQLDVAYDLLHQKNWPSWLYAVTQGATTIWERWNGWTHDEGFADPGMNSYNHYAYGAIGDWLYQTVAGIDADLARPGYQHIVMRPRPGGGLTHARASLKTMHGLVESGWKAAEGKEFEWEITVPPNTTATVHVPAKSGAKVSEGGKLARDAAGLKFVREEDGAQIFEAGSGAYQFSVA